MPKPSAIKYTSDQYIDPTTIDTAVLDTAAATNANAALLKFFTIQGGYGKYRLSPETASSHALLRPFPQHVVCASALAMLLYAEDEKNLDAVRRIITSDVAAKVLGFARRGNHHALIIGGLLAEHGFGMKSDWELAQKLYRSASKKGDATAHFRLAVLETRMVEAIQHGMHDAKIKAIDPEAKVAVTLDRAIAKLTECVNDSARLLLLAAEGENAPAQNRVAKLFTEENPPESIAKGLSKADCLSRALHYYELAWNQGLASAKYQQAQVLVIVGRTEDAIEAYKEILANPELVDSSGLAQVKMSLAGLYDRSQKYPEALAQYQSAKELGYAPAIVEMIARYHAGKSGFAEDWKEAAKWIRALHGLRDDQRGGFLKDDIPTIQKIETEILAEIPGTHPRFWIPNPDSPHDHLIPVSRAILNGNDDLDDAVVVPRGREAAIAWYEAAAKAGSTPATMIAAKLLSEDEREDEAFEMFCLAVERDNNAEAGLVIAERFVASGTDQNIALAFPLATKLHIARRGELNEVQQTRLDNLLSSLTAEVGFEVAERLFAFDETGQDDALAFTLSAQIYRERREELDDDQQARSISLRRSLLERAWTANSENVLCPMRYIGIPDLDSVKDETIRFFPSNETGLAALAGIEDISLFAAGEIALRFARGYGTDYDGTEAFRRLSNLLIDPRAIPTQEGHIGGVMPLEHPMRRELQEAWDELAVRVERHRVPETNNWIVFDPESDEMTVPYEFTHEHVASYDALCKMARRRVTARANAVPNEAHAA